MHCGCRLSPPCKFTCRDRYKTEPTCIVGHQDINFVNKIDPGLRFPWKVLKQNYGLGFYLSDSDVAWGKANFQADCPKWKTSACCVQKMLRCYGYGTSDTGKFDSNTNDAIKAFQAHFYPETTPGFGPETMSRIAALAHAGDAQCYSRVVQHCQ